MRRNALITGASRGIGFAIAERLAASGWNLTISARSPDTLNAARDKLAVIGNSVDAFVADMASEASVEELIAHALNATPELDLLVLAAGIGSAGQLEAYPLRRVDLQYAVNLRAPFQLMSRLLPALRAAAESNPEQGARVVALSSLTGHDAEPGLAAYGATKAALVRLCETLTTEEAETGVSATAISPGYVDTDMAAWMHDEIPPDTMIRVQDIAELVLTVAGLSRWAAIPEIVVTRPGHNLHRA